MQKLTRSILLLLFLFGAAFYGLVIDHHPSAAQAADDAWTPPVNLSNSGSTITPSLAVDSEGGVNVLWSDSFEGIIATRFSDGVWSEPVSGQFPFDRVVPELYGDGQGYIHAVWIADDDNLYYSRVLAANFASGGAWEASRQLGIGVVEFDLSIIGDSMHLAYVRVLDEGSIPAGIYYRNSPSSGAAWLEADPLYESPYFRSFTNDTANVSIATTEIDGEQNVYVAWDNRVRKRVFLSKSPDGGKTWNEAMEIDGPDPSLVIQAPFNLRVAVRATNVILTWSSNLQSGVDCAQFYQSSQDGGQTWGERQPLFTELVGCPLDSQYLAASDGTIVYAAHILNQWYLLAWNGVEWSQPQMQGMLSTAIDPVTLYSLELGNEKLVTNGATLYLVGDDQLESKDVWITSRSIGDLETWFPEPPAWTTPYALITSSANITSLDTVEDLNGDLHAFWLQIDETREDLTKIVVYHSSLKNGIWSQPLPVVHPPEGYASHLAATIDKNDRLYLAWSGGVAGEIYFSWADAQSASSAFEWTKPVTLPLLQLAGSGPDIVVDDEGMIHVSYVIPYNENRGVYVVSTSDQGLNWTDPVLVLDAAAEHWETLATTLLYANANNLYLMWERQAFAGSLGAQGLYYAKSLDGGLSWSVPEVVMEGEVVSKSFASDGSGNLLRIWNISNGEQPITYYQISSDQGATWTAVTVLANLGEQPVAVASVTDQSGRLHLLQTVVDPNQLPKLNYWVWERDLWRLQEAINLGEFESSVWENLSAVVMMEDELALLYSIRNQNQANQTSFSRLFYISHRFAPTQPLSETAGETPTATLILPPTHTPEVQVDAVLPTSAPVLTEVLPGTLPAPLDNSQQPGNEPTTGLVMVLLIVVVVVGAATAGVFVMRKMKS